MESILCQKIQLNLKNEKIKFAWAVSCFFGLIDNFFKEMLLNTKKLYLHKIAK